ncbi:MAG TPA: polyprenyl synthetase family protein [Gaiellaceae bacterium]|jgi:geranylgeranyl diphosphate synthase, type II|nr:polyprenyl synthetase family protein [Gaiellaceae bacterium]
MNSPDDLRRLAEDFLGGLPFAAELGKLEAALRYSLLGGGKRIRPVLCLATGEALGRNAEELLPAGCALELVHTFSLVHDDLPALDDDDLRRGQPSAHVQFGEDVAILAGDALLAEAFRLALRYPSPEVARELADATLGMIGGQYLDVTTDGELDPDGLRRLHALKTGRLLRASVTTATAVAALPEPEREQWRAFGDELGVLFQIVDDILDATGTAEELGKTPGKDEAAGKVTYVSLHGLDRARELADEARARVQERLDALPADTSVLAELVATIRDRRA